MRQSTPVSPAVLSKHLSTRSLRRSGNATAMLRLEFSRDALADLDSIYHHGLTAFGPEQAERYTRMLDQALRPICDYPAAGQIIEIAATNATTKRRLPCCRLINRCGIPARRARFHPCMTQAAHLTFPPTCGSVSRASKLGNRPTTELSAGPIAIRNYQNSLTTRQADRFYRRLNLGKYANGAGR